MPFVVKFLKSRGFHGDKFPDPADRQYRLYNSILGGNPWADDEPDENKTTARKIQPRMRPGGDLREWGKRFVSPPIAPTLQTNISEIRPLDFLQPGAPFNVIDNVLEAVHPAVPINSQGFKPLNPLGNAFNTLSNPTGTKPLLDYVSPFFPQSSKETPIAPPNTRIAPKKVKAKKTSKPIYYRSKIAKMPQAEYNALPESVIDDMFEAMVDGRMIDDM